MAKVGIRDARIAELEAQFKAALERIAELEARLGRNSRNSKRLPSSDGPGVERGKKPTTGRKPGGQPGHKGQWREVLPPEMVGCIEPVFLTGCKRCEGALVSKHLRPGGIK